LRYDGETSDVDAEVAPTKLSVGSCGYCLWRFSGPAVEELTSCSACGTRYHADCYAENGGCGMFGCSAWTAQQLGAQPPSPAVDRSPQPPLPPQLPALYAPPSAANAGAPRSSARFCTNCGTRSPTDSLFCGSCGQRLEVFA
jgi:hypothetical protein